MLLDSLDIDLCFFHLDDAYGSKTRNTAVEQAIMQLRISYLLNRNVSSVDRTVALAHDRKRSAT